MSQLKEDGLVALAKRLNLYASQLDDVMACDEVTSRGSAAEKQNMQQMRNDYLVAALLVQDTVGKADDFK